MTIKEWVTSSIKEPKEELIHLIGNLEDIGNKLENSKVTTLLLQLEDKCKKKLQEVMRK